MDTERTHPLRRLWRNAERHRRRVVFATSMSVANKFFDVAPEIIIGAALDVVVRNQDSFVADVTGIRRLAIGGGVAANSGLRTRLRETDLRLSIPPIARCTDNAAMIAHAGRLQLLAGREDDLSFGARAVWAVA